jgi:hypothetical protein
MTASTRAQRVLHMASLTRPTIARIILSTSASTGVTRLKIGSETVGTYSLREAYDIVPEFDDMAPSVQKWTAPKRRRNNGPSAGNGLCETRELVRHAVAVSPRNVRVHRHG